MATKTITLQIGGQKRQLKFGTMAFFEHAGEVFKGDPMELVYGFSTADILKAGSSNDEKFSLSIGISDPKKLYNIIHAFVYAGLICAGNDCDVNTVNQWVSDLDFTTGSKVLAEGRAALKGPALLPGEEKAQTSGKKKKRMSPGMN